MMNYQKFGKSSSFKASLSIMLLSFAWQTLILNGHTSLGLSPTYFCTTPNQGQFRKVIHIQHPWHFFPSSHLHHGSQGTLPFPTAKSVPSLSIILGGTQQLFYPWLCSWAPEKNDIYRLKIWDCGGFSQISILTRQNQELKYDSSETR